MVKQPLARTFWNHTDTIRVGRMILIGLAVGVLVRWLYLAAPPQPVLASGGGISAGTNAPAALKSGDASPSGRD